MDEREQFAAHVASIAEYRDHKLSESDTRAYLVDPLLRILGYQGVRNLRREVQVAQTREFLDYELLVDGQPQAIVEAKSMQSQLGDQQIAQCVQYAAVVGVRWCLITNGVTWVIYDAFVQGPLGQKRVAVVNLEKDTLERSYEVLSLFSLKSLASSSPLTTLLVERVVVDELTRGDSEAIKVLARAIRGRFGEKVTGEVIVRAIQRSFGTSPTVEASGPTSVAPQAGADSEQPTGPLPARRPTVGGSRITVAELVDAGFIPADAVLEARVGGVTHVARLRDGFLNVNGVDYPSPSNASVAVRKVRSWNGWVDWRYGGKTLAELRASYQRSRGVREEPGS